MKTRIAIIGCLLVLWPAAGAAEWQVPVVLPNIDQPFLQREAKILPSEFPLAQSLRPLLESAEHAKALALLNGYQEGKSAALLVLTGQLHMQLSNWRQAELALNQALKKMPDLMRAHLSLGSVYQIQGEHAKARQAISRAISLGAMEANNFAMLGYLNMQLDDPHAAVGAYQQALMLSPDNDDIRQGLLFALVNSSQFSAAASVLTGMINKSPSNSKLWAQRANMAFQAKQFDKALTSIEVALRLGDTSQPARQLAMQLHLKRDNVGHAIALSKKMLEEEQLAASDTDKLLTWLSHNKQWDHMQAVLKHINTSGTAKTALGTSRFLFHTANLALAQGRKDDARQAWEKAIEQNPGNGKALIALASLAADQGAFAEAELFYQRAERLSTVSLQAKLGRAQLYIEQLDYTAALTLLEKTLVEHPERIDLKENIKSLRSLAI